MRATSVVPDERETERVPVAKIKIQRKRATAWWPLLLLLLIPLAWYLWHLRGRERGAADDAPPPAAVAPASAPGRP